MQLPGHTTLRHHSMTCKLLTDIVYLILDKALRATQMIVPNGSFICFCFISSSRSSRNTTHFAVGCMTVFSPLPSHQACAVKLPCTVGSKVYMRTHQSASDFTSHFQSAVQKESCVFFSSLSHNSSHFLCHMSSALKL